MAEAVSQKQWHCAEFPVYIHVQVRLYDALFCRGYRNRNHTAIFLVCVLSMPFSVTTAVVCRTKVADSTAYI